MLARREIGRALQYRAAAGWSRLLSRTRVTRVRGVWSLLHVMQSVQRRNVSRAGLTITFYGGAPGEIGGTESRSNGPRDADCSTSGYASAYRQVLRGVVQVKEGETWRAGS